MIDCPICGDPCKSMRGLNTHKAMKHGVLSDSPKSRANQAWRKRSGTVLNRGIRKPSMPVEDDGCIGEPDFASEGPWGLLLAVVYQAQRDRAVWLRDLRLELQEGR